MMDSPFPPDVANTEAPPPVAPLSVTDKFIGILTEPASTFENLRQAGMRASDWLVPVLILTIVIAAATYIQMTDPAMKEQLRQKTEQQFDEQVASGKMTPQQKEQAISMMEKMGSLQAIFAVGGVIIFVPVVLLLMALIYWLILKFGFKGSAAYSMIFAAAALTTYIGAIDQIVILLISIVTKNFYATFSLGFFMAPNLTSPAYKLISALDPISIWSSYVMALGFSKVSGVSKGKTLTLVFGLWIAWVLVGAFVKLPFGAMQ